MDGAGGIRKLTIKRRKRGSLKLAMRSRVADVDGPVTVRIGLGRNGAARCATATAGPLETHLRPYR
jgi:hypothetical protein